MSATPDPKLPVDPTDTLTVDKKRPRFWRRRRQTRPVTLEPRRRRMPFDLRKALFILPNAFTISSIFCGFYSILLSTSGEGPDAFRRAGIALFFAAFFDGIDGRVARLTRTQSDFGVQIDSLADVISFGVSPAVLVYEWGLKNYQPLVNDDLHLVGKLIAFTFCACGAIRLARFNVLAARGQGSSKYFIGLPIPGAATMLISIIIAQVVMVGEPVQALSAIAAVVVALSYLMVSRVRFRTFKDFRPRVKNMPVLLGLVALLALSIVYIKLSLTFVFLVGGYVALGLVEEVVFYKKRRQLDVVEKAAALARTTTGPA